MAASRVACASFNIGTNTTISITRDNKNYTHTLTFKFGSYTGTIATKTTSTSVVWTPTASTLYAQIPNAVSGYGTITCQTYNGNTLVGTTTAGFYAYAVKNECLPDVSATVVDTNASTIALTGNSNKFVRWISKPKVTVTATPKNGTTINSINIDMLGQYATSSPYTFNEIYDNYYYVTATDKRGYSTRIKPTIANFVAYDPCYFTSKTLKRTESTSTTATLNLSGYCFKGNFGTTDNTLTIKYRYKTASGSYGSYVNITPTWNTDGTFTATTNVTNLSLTEQYTFEVIAQDKLTSFGDGEEILLTQGIGDLRIAGNYVQTKNDFRVGSNENTEWKSVRVRRKIEGVNYSSNLGAGASPSTKLGESGYRGTLALQLVENDGTSSESVAARFDIKNDGYMYNTLTNMSVAEIMSMATSSQGYCILNGGSSNPILIQWGRVSITPTGAWALTQAEIHFIHQFQGIPMIFTDKITWDSDVVFVNPYQVEEGKFIMHLKRHNVVSTVIQWVAIGNGSYALPE